MVSADAITRPADASLDREGETLRDALTQLVRVLQFRNRDCLCDREISATQCHALEAVLERGPLTLNALSAALYIEKSTASRVVAGLVKKGYVAKTSHPRDGRAVLLHATETGRRFCAEIQQDLLADCKRLLSDFDPEIRAAMTALISRMARAAAARVDTSGGACCTVDSV